jgi:dipeptidyl aminopeptidase/acylaminoacyl peptidase
MTTIYAPSSDWRYRPMRTAVLLPPGARRGDRLPVILHLYGGADVSEEAREYGGGYVSTIPTPVFTSRGYAVLLADAPLGPNGKPGNPVEELREVILPQLYRAAELGYIDIRRVAATGQSYGGYCTAALVSSTNLFRAAVAVSGSYDLPGDYSVPSTDDNHFQAE